jgi:putative tryptophan/tyrosine transport system substrate-binding protein
MYRAWGIGLLLLSVVAGAAAAGAPAFGASAADSGEQGAAVRLAVRAPSVEDADAFTGALRALGGDSLRLVEQDADLVLALGEQAFRDALAADGPPVLGLAVPRRAADQLITNHCRCGAIWQGVPLDTQLALLRALLPEARRIGILRAPHSVWRSVPSAPPGLTLEAVTVPQPARLGALLRRHLPNWDALLLPEDGTLFDGGAARLVLLTSYRQRVPVVGPDGAYVRAGSVASARVLVKDLAAAALDAVHAHRRLGRWPAAGFAGHYSLAINEHVAGAYDLDPVERAPLERLLEATP